VEAARRLTVEKLGEKEGEEWRLRIGYMSEAIASLMYEYTAIYRWLRALRSLYYLNTVKESLPNASIIELNALLKRRIGLDHG
jgi:hypothetical protein